MYDINSYTLQIKWQLYINTGPLSPNIKFVYFNIHKIPQMIIIIISMHMNVNMQRCSFSGCVRTLLHRVYGYSQLTCTSVAYEYSMLYCICPICIYILKWIPIFWSLYISIQCNE